MRGVLNLAMNNLIYNEDMSGTASTDHGQSIDMMRLALLH
jgi:hypothetical protein